MRFGFNRMVGTKSKPAVWVMCPFAQTSPIEDPADPVNRCTVKKPYRVDLNSLNAHDLMNAHIDKHTEAESNRFGLRIKRIGCQVCPWVTKPFESNNALTTLQIGSEEAEAIEAYEAHIKTHLKCENHTTPGEQQLVYYFKDQDDLALHTKRMHTPKKKFDPPKKKIGPRYTGIVNN